ncbi:MAG TPA: GAF domain-containing protein [Anaerolineales bacterium]|nr:GAF domain-containing protein [Anaerolineales bacterium]HUM26674.1 GAF domain-containing protein [Anaerolineales bacterium]
MLKSLQGRLSTLFIAFVLLVLTSVGATFWGVKTQQKDALVINLAGRQRMLVQLMTRLAMEHQDDATKETLTQAETTFEQTLSALEDGGTTTYLPDNFVTLPPTQDAEIIAALEVTRESWGKFRASIDLIQSMPKGAAGLTGAIQGLDVQSALLAQQADKVVQLYEASATTKLNILRNIQIIFLLLALILLGAGAVVTRQSLLRPLTELGVAATRLGENDLEYPVQVQGPEEMRNLSQSFDGMRVNLNSARQELIDLNNNLEKRVVQRTQELEALNVVSQEITSRLDIEQVLNSVTDKSRALVGGEVSFLCLLDHSQRNLSLQTFSGSDDAAVGDVTIVKDHDLTATIVGSEKAVVCGIDSCREGCAILSQKYRGSHLAAPLRINEQIIGALCVGSSSPQRFGEESAELLTKLANTAAIALENARLYEQAERIATLEERRRIAAEMHDGLGQTLSYLGLMTDQVVDFLSNEKEEAAMERLHHTRETIEKATGDVRKAINQLMDEDPIRMDLCDQMEMVAREFSSAGTSMIEWNPKGIISCSCSTEMNEQVIHIVREALTNAVSHAHAERIYLQFNRNNGIYTLNIEDNGDGFDSSQPSPSGHFGLRIMKARALRVGGSLTIHSAPGQGTQVILSFPAENAGI